MIDAEHEGGEAVGYGRPPQANRFKKGQSGNPKGRPRNKRRDIPYDPLLGQMVTVREDGRERRITAAEAFLLQLTKRGLAGDSAAARASLAAIETARASRYPGGSESSTICINWRCFGMTNTLADLGLGVLLNPENKEKVQLLLKPWIVEAALARLGERQLSRADQAIVIASTRTPGKVKWPEWWSER